MSFIPKDVILRLINLYERDITPFLNLLSVMGGYHTCNQECKVFARKSLTRWGGELETAESARSSTCAKRAMQACLGKEGHQNHPPLTLPPKVRMPSFNYLEFLISQMMAAVASLRAIPPHPHRPT